MANRKKPIKYMTHAELDKEEKRVLRELALVERHIAATKERLAQMRTRRQKFQ